MSENKTRIKSYIGGVIVAILIVALCAGAFYLKYDPATDLRTFFEEEPPKEEETPPNAELVKRVTELEEQHKSLKKLYAETAEKLALMEKKTASLSRMIDEIEDAQYDFFDEMEARLTKLTSNQKADYAKLRDEIDDFARDVEHSRQTWK